MVILRSGSVTAVDDSINMTQMTSEQFALFLVEACKQPDIGKVISDIVSPRDQEFADAVSAEVHRQMTPLRKQLDEKNAELQRLKNIIHDQQTMIDDIEQHGRRDSLRFESQKTPTMMTQMQLSLRSVVRWKLNLKLNPRILQSRIVWANQDNGQLLDRS